MHSPLKSAPLSRQLSLGSVVGWIVNEGPVSRAAIAKGTGLSKQTVSEVVRGLEAEGWVRPTGSTRGGVGRRATTYEICPDAAFVLGVDLGGTKVHAAIANLACEVVGEEWEPTDAGGGQAVIRQIAALADRIARNASVPCSKIRLAALGTPGVVHPQTGAIRLAPNVPGLDTFDAIAALREELGAPVIVENDVNVAAIGEQWIGCARGASTFAFLAIGTGVGLGLLADGKLMRGAHGAAGEIAYLPVGDDPFDPATREHGSLEAAVGAAGILRRFEAAGGSPAVASVRDIFDAVGRGDPIARTTVIETARLLALAVMSVSTLIDPELIVLGGSIGVRPELLGAVRDILPSCMAEPVRVEASMLGSRAGIVGALAVAINNIHNSLFGPAILPKALALPALPGLRGLELAA
jgi:predicted NBD/HSP70 family sugar kinase